MSVQITTTVRGIRGAIQVASNTQDEIYLAAANLIFAIQEKNPHLQPDDIASVFFTLTPDLDAAFPALSVRRLGWSNVPMLCAQEIPVPGSLERCLRVLIHWNTTLPQEMVHHVYLGGASILRPDLAK